MLASGPAGPKEERGVWVISTLTGTIRKLREDAWVTAVSGDGRHIAVTNGASTEIWIVGASGEDPRKLVAAEKGAIFTAVAWSPDSQRIAYLKRQGVEEAAIESRDLAGGPTTVILSDRRLRAFCWAPDGAILAARIEPPPNETSFNLWEIRERREPRRLTNWAGFAFWHLSRTADGKRLLMVRGHWQSDVYVGELENNGARLMGVRRLTQDDRTDWPGAWIRDNQAIVFHSDRNGTFDIFKQGIQDRSAELVVGGLEEQRDPQLSPDGFWILYLAWTHPPGGAPSTGRLMRIPVSGGAPQLVMEVTGRTRTSPRERDTLVSRGYPGFGCASPSGKLCVLAEAVQDQVVFSAFDPVEGRKGEVGRVDVDPATITWTFWDLSPDGSRIAFARRVRGSGRIQVLPVAGGAPSDVNVKGWSLLESVAWSVDGQSLYATSYSSKGNTLLHVALNGEAKALHKSTTWLERIVPSPDGRRLAFTEVNATSNAWMIENFR